MKKVSLFIAALCVVLVGCESPNRDKNVKKNEANINVKNKPNSGMNRTMSPMEMNQNQNKNKTNANIPLNPSR